MTEEERIEFGGYLARLRAQKSLSLRQVQNAGIGITSSYLHQIEKGMHNPPKPAVLARLADVYGVSYDAIMAAAKIMPEASNRKYYAALENAFDFVRNHHAFKFGTQLAGEHLTPGAKRYIIELFEAATHLKVLTDDDKLELDPQIEHGDEA